MSAVSPKPSPIKWWEQFPTSLRTITKSRFLVSMGAGGVIYLTPLVFNQKDFSATQIGIGIAIAALIGTIARFASGLLLDKGINCAQLVKATAFLGIIADLTLFNAQNYSQFLQGQLIIGLATGLYWPSIELAVPLSCGIFPSSKGFALGRSADALGISTGVCIGSIAAWAGAIKLIYLFDIFWMFCLFCLLKETSIKNLRKKQQNRPDKNHYSLLDVRWINPLVPILFISLLATGILSLMQSALPIDLVRGGIYRPEISEGWSGAIIAVQLILLVIIQWPTGKWVAGKKLTYGFKVSLLGLGIGCLLIGLSSLFVNGALLILMAQLPISFGLAVFLPTSTEAIISATPLEKQGIAMALFSQCFAISAFIAPIISGKLLDSHGNGLILWTSVFMLCILFFSILNNKDIKLIKS